MAAFPVSVALAALAWPFAAATLPADSCDGGDRCSMSLLQTAQGARRAAAGAAAGAPMAAGAVEKLEGLEACELTAEQREFLQGWEALELSEEQKQVLMGLEAFELTAAQKKALETGRGQKAGWNLFESMQNGISRDMNGHACALCNGPFPERVDREYTKRTDCGNHSMFRHPLAAAVVPIVTHNRPATATRPETNAWCELNEQKMCADAIYNKDFLYQAKSVEYPPFMNYDPLYCLHNGWLEPEIVALQHDFEGMKKKSEEVCQDPKYAWTKWNTTMTMLDFGNHYMPGMARGFPTKQEALFVGAWTCAMGSSGCDLAYCAYSFCKQPDGSIGKYSECPGWHPVKGMPIAPAAQ